MRKKLKNAGMSIVQGNVAMMEGAIAANCKFFAGYPITPATEIAEHAALRLPEEGGYYIQMEDELGSICACIGASLAGDRAMTATSGPGFCQMTEGLGAAACIERPVVIAYLMRGGPAGGQATMPSQMDVYQARYGSQGDYELIAICPSSVQESFDFTIKAFELADKYMTPVVILSDAIIGHLREKLVIPEEVEVFDNKVNGPVEYWLKPGEDLVPPHVSFFEGSNAAWDITCHDYRGKSVGGNVEESAAFVRRLNMKITENADAISDVRTYYEDDMEVGIICYGSVFRPAISAVEKLRKEGIKAGCMKLNTIWPVPEKQINSFCSKAEHIVVPEMNIGKYVREIQRLAGIEKVSSASILGGALFTPEQLCDKVREVLGK